MQASDEFEFASVPSETRPATTDTAARHAVPSSDGKLQRLLQTAHTKSPAAVLHEYCILKSLSKPEYKTHVTQEDPQQPYSTVVLLNGVSHGRASAAQKKLSQQMAADRTLQTLLGQQYTSVYYVAKAPSQFASSGSGLRELPPPSPPIPDQRSASPTADVLDEVQLLQLHPSDKRISFCLMQSKTPSSLLSEYCNCHHLSLPQWSVARDNSSALYTVTVRLPDIEATGVAAHKKISKQLAAQEVLCRLFPEVSTWKEMQISALKARALGSAGSNALLDNLRGEMDNFLRDREKERQRVAAVCFDEAAQAILTCHIRARFCQPTAVMSSTSASATRARPTAPSSISVEDSSLPFLSTLTPAATVITDSTPSAARFPSSPAPVAATRVSACAASAAVSTPTSSSASGTAHGVEPASPALCVRSIAHQVSAVIPPTGTPSVSASPLQLSSASPAFVPRTQSPAPASSSAAVPSPLPAAAHSSAHSPPRDSTHPDIHFAASLLHLSEVLSRYAQRASQLPLTTVLEEMERGCTLHQNTLLPAFSNNSEQPLCSDVIRALALLQHTATATSREQVTFPAAHLRQFMGNSAC